MSNNSAEALKAEAERIYASTPREDIKRHIFKDWGTKNMWSDEKWDEFMLANAIHKIDKAKHPADHEILPQVHNWRGWQEDNCSCGFCSSCDSSD